MGELSEIPMMCGITSETGVLGDVIQVGMFANIPDCSEDSRNKDLSDQIKQVIREWQPDKCEAQDDTELEVWVIVKKKKVQNNKSERKKGKVYGKTYDKCERRNKYEQEAKRAKSEKSARNQVQKRQGSHNFN